MKKIVLSLSFLTFLILHGIAQQRTREEAEKIATQFVQQKAALRTAQDVYWVYTRTEAPGLRASSDEEAYFYVFNAGDNGFVIVSGDERAEPILGYSDESLFDPANLPDNLRYWLSFYQDEIALLKNEQAVAEASSAGLRQTSASSVHPLLGKIKYDQGTSDKDGDAYNMLCPSIEETKTVTGCVATGMAQVMRYHKWPLKGTGSNVYTPPQIGDSLSVNFGTTTYDWDNMLETYSGTETYEEKTAIATLMYHCGVAVNMDYGLASKGGSGATSVDMANALINHFGYDPGAELLSREYYSKAQWEQIMKAELDAARPVLYSGVSTAGGHLFVCDGYDSDFLFHINWGWSGLANGYFALSALTPGTQGTGGGSGGFNFSQDALIGVQKPTGDQTDAHYQLYGSFVGLPTSSVALGSSIGISYSAGNIGATTTFVGYFALGLFDENDQFRSIVSTVASTGLEGLKPGYYAPEISTTITLPNGTASGNYAIRVVYRATGQTTWTRALSTISNPNKALVAVASSKATFSAATMDLKLTLNRFSQQNLSLYKNKTAMFDAEISNTGSTDLMSMIALKFVSHTTGAVYYLSNHLVVVGAGETSVVEFQDQLTSLPVGNYLVYVAYNKNNEQTLTMKPSDYLPLGNPLTATVKAEPTVSELALSLISASFTHPDSITPSTFRFEVKVKNSADYFDRPLYLYYNDPATMEDYFTWAETKNIVLDVNQEGAYVFTSIPDLPAGQYRIAVIYRDISNEAQWLTTMNFEMKEDKAASIENESVAAKSFQLYPNPATDWLVVQSEHVVRTIRLYDLTGKQAYSSTPNAAGEIPVYVQDLEKGTYLLRLTTDQGVETAKFIKQ